MRPSFTDFRRLKAEAKRAVEGGASFIRRWWSHKYKLPTNDSRFEERSIAEWMCEMYEDLYERKAEIEIQLVDEMTPMRERTSLMARLRKLNKMLDEELEVSDDPLIDKWEAELESGVTPDLDEDTPSRRE